MGGLYKCAYSARTYIMTININLLHILCVVEIQQPASQALYYLYTTALLTILYAGTSHMNTDWYNLYFMQCMAHTKQLQPFVYLLQRIAYVCNIFTSLHINPFMETDHPYFSQPPASITFSQCSMLFVFQYFPYFICYVSAQWLCYADSGIPIWRMYLPHTTLSACFGLQNQFILTYIIFAIRSRSMEKKSNWKIFSFIIPTATTEPNNENDYARRAWSHTVWNTTEFIYE